MQKTVLHSVFEHTVEQFPTRIAIEHDGQCLTYTQVNQVANRLAHALQSHGTDRETVIGIFLPAGSDYVISLLGVAKAGGVFLPLDVQTPPKRLYLLLQKTKPLLIITQPPYIETLKTNLAEMEGEASIPCLILNETATFPDTNLPLMVDGDTGSYIMFTSGSTGDPKAILGCHKGLSHFIHWELQEFSLNEQIRVSQLAPTTFDVSLRDLFVPLIAGGTLCIPLPEERLNPSRLLAWMHSQRLTLVHCVPSVFRLLTRELSAHAAPGQLLPDLHYMLLAGEPLYGSDVLKWRAMMGTRIAMVNLYGPSETTLAKVFYRIPDDDLEAGRMVPVGKPLPNTAVLILKNGALCHIGEIGEIHIKTPFRSKGYYQAPELTAQSFIQNPLNSEAEDIIYKTGDLGRYLTDRSVELLGRLDNQVKINGIRVELAEIEQNLLRYEAIDQVVVLAHDTADHEPYLTCYYLANRPFEHNDLRAFLTHWLPEPMIPRFFVRLDAFPLNLHGKIDRRALPKPEELLYQRIGYEAPADEIEARLAEIWKSLLGLKMVGVNNPFIELGGDSLKAIRMISQLYHLFQQEVSFQEVFPHATVRTLAEKIRQRHNPPAGATAISAAEQTVCSDMPSQPIQQATAEELALLD